MPHRGGGKRSRGSPSNGAGWWADPMRHSGAVQGGAGVSLQHLAAQPQGGEKVKLTPGVPPPSLSSGARQLRLSVYFPASLGRETWSQLWESKRAECFIWREGLGH